MIIAVNFQFKHREHTILLNRERVNIGTKRMNSLPLSPLASHLSYAIFTGKTAAYTTEALYSYRAPLTLPHGFFLTKKVLQNLSVAPIYYRGISLKRFRY